VHVTRTTPHVRWDNGGTTKDRPRRVREHPRGMAYLREQADMTEPTAGEPLCVIYALSINGADYRYVGMTQIGAEARLRIHRKTGRSPKLPSARWIKKHQALGEAIRVTVLEECTPENIGDREAAWIERLRSEGHDLLNVTEGGRGGLPGFTHTDEARAKMSAKLKGRTFDDEWRARLSAASSLQERRPVSEETREKLRVAMVRRGPMTAEQRAKQSAAMRGRKLSAEHRAALSAGAKRRPPQSEETRRKRSETLRGHELSEETRRKIAASNSRTYAARRGLLITDEIVRDIRAAADSGTPIRELASRFALPYNQTWRIAKRRSWKHVE
jgi:hypothetical protein